MSPITDLQNLIRSMEPHLQSGTYVYVLCDGIPPLNDPRIVAAMREAEGLSLIVEKSFALENALEPHFECAWITLKVHSDLAAVGLTAAFATALGASAVSCNVVAGLHHDHLFVPVQEAARAMDVLHALQRSAHPSVDPSP